MRTLMLPTVNLNGSPRSDLISQHIEVANAARALLEALAKASPHGRDYPSDPATLQEARAVHSQYYRGVLTIEEDYLRTALAIHRGESS